MADGTKLKVTEDLVKQNNGRITDMLGQIKSMEEQVANQIQAQASFEQRIEVRFEKIFKLLNDSTLEFSNRREYPLGFSVRSDLSEGGQSWGNIGQDAKDFVSLNCSEISSESSDNIILGISTRVPLNFCHSKFTPQEFTEEAREALVYALTMAASMGQKCETEHLMKALLEQSQGLVHRVLTEVSIDSTVLLNITNEFIKSQPKQKGQSGLLFGSELEALLRRAVEWKEEYGDLLISVEHLLWGFQLDNRVGNQLYKEGNAVEISLKILDAIEFVRKAKVFKDQEDSSEVSVSGENQDDTANRVTGVTQIKQGKSLDANEGKANGIGYVPFKLNTIELKNSALTVFDEMSKREHSLCKAPILKVDSALSVMKQGNVSICTSLPIFIQSNGRNVVEFSNKTLNESNNFNVFKVDLASITLWELDVSSWKHIFVEDKDSSADMVIGRALQCAGLVLDIKEIVKEDKLDGSITSSSDAQFEQRRKAHHCFEQLQQKIKPNTLIFVFDPGGSKAAIEISILEDKDVNGGGNVVILGIR